MELRDIMTRDVEVVSGSASVKEAAVPQTLAFGIAPMPAEHRSTEEY